MSGVKRFRTKVVDIEAIQWTGQNHGEVFDFSGGQFNSFPEDNEGFTGLIYDKLHETWIKVATGQWIIKGTKDEFYPCDPETFDWKYEEIKFANGGVVIGPSTVSINLSEEIISIVEMRKRWGRRD